MTGGAPRRGKLITLEGLDFAGKTTQIEGLKARLGALGERVMVVREPGGTPIGERIRRLLKDPAEGAGMAPLAELMLFCAARAQILAEVIRPALEDGQVVICDRFHDSTTAYQGARGIPLSTIRGLHRTVLGETRPDLTLLLDLPDAEREARRATRNGPACRLDGESAAFFSRVRAIYLEEARMDPGRIRVLEARGTEAEVAAGIWAAVGPLLDRPGGGLPDERAAWPAPEMAGLRRRR